MKQIIRVTLVFTLLLRCVIPVQALCGTWIANPPGCYDANYNLIQGDTQQCGNGACCTSLSECTPNPDPDPFLQTPEDEEPEPQENTPAPPPVPSSSQTDPDLFTDTPRVQKCGTFLCKHRAVH